MDTLRAILALVLLKKLKLQQMDVKGAYLNGILKEKIYMQQPEGCDDRTGWICRLIKMLYGLQQAGREWNKQVDDKLRKRGYSPLLSDPCIYVRWNGNEFAIMIWVDDMLLFALSDEMMDQLKDALQKEWTVTDLGEPTKIVGIEITCTGNSIFISQRKYTEGILQNVGMLDANAVTTPMDPNLKLVPNPEENEPNRSNAFAHLIGQLQFVANAT
jgi:hypothetical protein